jgi:hypothetical protein
MTTELETRSDAVSGTVRSTSYSSGSHRGFQSGDTRVKHGFMLPLGQFLLCNSSYHTETCFTRFLFVSENTNCFYNPIRLIDQNQNRIIIDQNQNRIMEAYNMNIKNHRNIRTPGSGGMSCT